MYIKEKKNVHEANSIFCCGHARTKTITVQLLCYVPRGGGGAPRILDRGVPRRIVNPNPI